MTEMGRDGGIPAGKERGKIRLKEEECRMKGGMGVGCLRREEEDEEEGSEGRKQGVMKGLGEERNGWIDEGKNEWRRAGKERGGGGEEFRRKEGRSDERLGEGGEELAEERSGFEVISKSNRGGQRQHTRDAASLGQLS